MTPLAQRGLNIVREGNRIERKDPPEVEHAGQWGLALADDAAAVWLYVLPNIVVTKPGITGVPRDPRSLSCDVTTIARA